MKVVTWNVNGLRPIITRYGGLDKLLALFSDADIVCFQETKVLRTGMVREMALLKGW